MIRKLTIMLALFALAGAAIAARLTVKDLPATVQTTVNDNLNGGEIRNIGKETEHGITQYEVETMRNGKHRDFNVNAKGALLVVEEETTIDSIPAAAKAAILKKVGDGKLRTVEIVNKPGTETMFEAAWTSKSGRKFEVLVKADGGQNREH
jgi:hypothetical protein